MPIAIDVLVELEEVDLRIGDALFARDHGPREISLLEKNLQPLDAAMRTEEQKLKKIRDDLKKQEDAVQMEDRMLKKKQERLPQIANQKEYQASMREMEASKMDIGVLSEEIVVLEDRSLKQEEIFLAAKKSFDEMKSALDEKRLEVDKRLSTLEEDLRAFRAKREGLAKQIDASILSKYDRLRKKTHKSILRRATSTLCPNCHMNIMPQRFNDLRKMEDLVICDSCLVLLYWKEDETGDSQAKAP